MLAEARNLMNKIIKNINAIIISFNCDVVRAF